MLLSLRSDPQTIWLSLYQLNEYHQGYLEKDPLYSINTKGGGYLKGY